VREVVVSWLSQALSLQPGEQLLLEAKTRYLQKQTFERFKKELERLKEVNQDFETLSLSMDMGREKGRLWIVVSKLAPLPKVGLIRKADGSLQKTSYYSKAVIRRVSLMLQDGIGKEEIAEIENIPLEDVAELVLICCSTDENLKNFPQEEVDGQAQ
jgi:hypothetical protein